MKDAIIKSFKEKFACTNDPTTCIKGSNHFLFSHVWVDEVTPFLSQALDTVEEETRKETKTILDWATGDNTGLSSKYLCRYMMGLQTNGYPYPPSDKWDRGRCIDLLNLIPAWWDRLDELVKVSKDWEKQIPLIKKEAKYFPSEEKE